MDATNVCKGAESLASGVSNWNGDPIIDSEKVYSPIGTVAALWKHARAMLEKMQARQIEWPHMSAEDMSDVVAF